MDTRDTPEQAELRRAARQLASELGPRTVADLDDHTRAKRLALAVRDAGWLDLRADAGTGEPLASGVEAGIVADSLGGAVADVAYAGPALAADLARHAGIDASDGAVVAFAPDLTNAAIVEGAATVVPMHAVDTGSEGDRAYLLAPGRSGFQLAHVRFDATVASNGSDLTRGLRTIPEGTSVEVVEGQTRPITDDDVVRWTALGLALTSADLVGVMRGALRGLLPRPALFGMAMKRGVPYSTHNVVVEFAAAALAALIVEATFAKSEAAADTNSGTAITKGIPTSRQSAAAMVRVNTPLLRGS